MSVDQWDQRELCPDGACTGVIGAQGTCKTCGRVAPNWGDPRRRGLIEEPEEKPVVASEDKGDWDARTLCADGACTGVIGTSGVCKVCGKRADGSEPEDREPLDREIDDEESFENEADEDDEADDADDDDDREVASDEDDDDDEADEADDDDDEADDDEADEADERQNCPDGACIGLIGANNKCKVCGKAAA